MIRPVITREQIHYYYLIEVSVESKGETGKVTYQVCTPLNEKIVYAMVAASTNPNYKLSFTLKAKAKWYMCRGHVTVNAQCVPCWSETQDLEKVCDALQHLHFKQIEEVEREKVIIVKELVETTL